MDEFLRKIVNELETMISEDRTIEDLKKDFQKEIEELEETLSIYISENDPKFFEMEFPDKRYYLSKKIAQPYEYFKCIDAY